LSFNAFESSDFSDLRFAELRPRMARTKIEANATLLFHIPHVISLGAEPKMVRIDAAAIVASVTHKKTFWDRGFVQFVR
jgi:hypothetical protein